MVVLCEVYMWKDVTVGIISVMVIIILALHIHLLIKEGKGSDE